MALFPFYHRFIYVLWNRGFRVFRRLLATVIHKKWPLGYYFEQMTPYQFDFSRGFWCDLNELAVLQWKNRIRILKKNYFNM